MSVNGCLGFLPADRSVRFRCGEPGHGISTVNRQVAESFQEMALASPQGRENDHVLATLQPFQGLERALGRLRYGREEIVPDNKFLLEGGRGVRGI